MSNENEQEVQLEQNPKILGAVDLPKVDLKPFNGQKAKITELTYEDHAKHGKYAKIVTNTLEGSPDGLEIKASKILGLVEIKNKETGEVDGYGWGKESNTASFLKTVGVETLNDLIGIEVLVLYQVTKKGKEVLTF